MTSAILTGFLKKNITEKISKKIIVEKRVDSRIVFLNSRYLSGWENNSTKQHPKGVSSQL